MDVTNFSIRRDFAVYTSYMLPRRLRQLDAFLHRYNTRNRVLYLYESRNKSACIYATVFLHAATFSYSYTNYTVAWFIAGRIEGPGNNLGVARAKDRIRVKVVSSGCGHKVDSVD